MRRITPLDVRFWRHVAKGPGCWEWLGCRGTTGYGMFGWGSRRPIPTIGAHRASYRLNVGPIPAGLCVLHHCDNRGCVRPDHLFLGTKRDNAMDMYQKGRWSCKSRVGEANSHAKLSTGDVVEIRQSTLRPKEIAARFGVTSSCVYCIRKRTQRREVA
jgi:hypothetical protein